MSVVTISEKEKKSSSSGDITVCTQMIFKCIKRTKTIVFLDHILLKTNLNLVFPLLINITRSKCNTTLAIFPHIYKLYVSATTNVTENSLNYSTFLRLFFTKFFKFFCKLISFVVFFVFVKKGRNFSIATMYKTVRIPTI